MKPMQNRAMPSGSFPNPSATTVVVGCYSQISANEVAMVDGVDYVIGNHDKLNFDYISGMAETPVVVRSGLIARIFPSGGG